MRITVATVATAVDVKPKIDAENSKSPIETVATANGYVNKKDIG